ncbi:hypothetical protein [Streptomyces sp. NPDC054975]
MSTRTLLALSGSLLTISFGVGLTGMATNRNGLMHTGILGTVAAGAGLVCATLRHTNQVNSDELDAAHNDGYRLGLQHVTLGLLDPPPTGGTVVPLHPEFPRQHERQAQ